MIISNKREYYDGSWRLVMYETDSEGKCVPRVKKSDFDDDIDTYYVQREIELKRLQEELLARHISPICFFLKYFHMDIKDVAARMKLSKKTVKKHMTSKGFGSVTIEALQQYARIFDISVSDFFQFIYITEDLSLKVEKYNDRLVQHVTISNQPQS